MGTMQKLMKKNNKGFSLVELIVVILIIGILAIAIAPQVTKWVGRADVNQAKNELATVVSAVQVAVADFLSEGKTLNDEAKITIAPSNNGPTINVTGITNSTGLKTKVEEIITDSPKNDIVVKVTTAGAVTATSSAIN